MSESCSALRRALEMQQAAAQEGFDWDELSPMWDKLDEEIGELREAIDERHGRERIEAELGDILFMVVNIARKLDIDPDSAVECSNQSFTTRYDDVRRQLADRGIRLSEASLAEMEACWQRAKQLKHNNNDQQS